jgi:hypothetical protein
VGRRQQPLPPRRSEGRRSRDHGEPGAVLLPPGASLLFFSAATKRKPNSRRE